MRRVAGLTTLALLVPLAFFTVGGAPSVGADESVERPEVPLIATVEPGCVEPGDETAEVVVTVMSGYRVYVSDSDGVVETIDAKGRILALGAGDYTWFAYFNGDEKKSHLVEGDFSVAACSPVVEVEPGCVEPGDETAEVVVTVPSGYRVYVSDSVGVVVEVNAPGSTVALGTGDYTWVAHEITDGKKEPTLDGEFSVEPCPPGDADVTVAFGCTREDAYAVTYSTTNAAIAWTVDGESSEVISGQTFDPGTAVSWVATADKGYELDDSDDVEGDFAAERCDRDPSPRPRPTSGEIRIVKQAPGTERFAFQASWTSVGFTLANNEVHSSGQLPSGTYQVNETLNVIQVDAGWRFGRATCTDGSPINAIQLAAGEVVTCTFENAQVLAEVVVASTTTVGVAAVAVGTLPFTGTTAVGTGMIALFVLALGGLVVLVATPVRQGGG